MKLIAVLILMASLQVSANGFSQTISLNLRNAPFVEALSSIEKQTGFTFVYATELIKQAKPVSISIKNATLIEALDACIKDQPLSYQIIDKTTKLVALKLKEEKQPSFSATVIQTPVDVYGRITDPEGNPLGGASVRVRGTTIGTSSNEKGEFTLKGIEDKTVLEISYVGFETQYFSLDGTNTIAIKLSRKISPLDETQIIAYGTTTQRFNTGSVTKVTSEEIGKQPIDNPLAALQGRVPGLTVSSTSGIPGATIKIQIRGQNSLASTPSALFPPFDNPLFIIDGVPTAIQNANINQFNSLAAPYNNGAYNNTYGGYSPFANLNPSDIESIEVLRDADATAIYGSRGANGVILITTKKGKAGKTKVSAEFYTGISKVTKVVKMMNTSEYLTMRKEAYKNDGVAPSSVVTSSNFAPDLLFYDSTKYTDWSEYFLSNNARITNSNVSISGGNINTQFLVGAGIRHETYIFPGDFSDDLGSVNMNLSNKSEDKKFFLNFSGNYSYHKNNSSGSPAMLLVQQMEPNHPDLLDKDGNLVWNYNGFNIDGSYSANPLAYTKTKYSIAAYNLVSSLQVGYNILPNLVLRSNMGYNTLNSNEYSAIPKSSFSPSLGTLASANFGTNNSNGWIIEPQLEFNHFVKGHKFDFLVGSTFQNNNINTTQTSGSNYISDALLGSIVGAGATTSSDGNIKYKYSAIFGRVNYIYDKKYILNLTGRRDGSSRFGWDKKFGNFGSIGAGWLFSEESFVKKNFSFLSYGKLRGSYGTTGSDAVGDYMYIERWGRAGYSYQGIPGFIPVNLANSEFSWGVTKKIEASIELGILHDRLLFSITSYRNRSSNQLIAYPVPTQVGFGTVTENWNATVQNSGIEIQMTATAIKSKTLSWEIYGNLTVPKNKLVSFPGIENSPYLNRYIVGKSLSTLNKFVFLGVNDTTGVFQFQSAQKTPTYSPTAFTDYQIIGNLDPKYFGGLGSNLSIKNVSFSFFLEFKKQLGVNYLSQIYLAGLPGREFNQPEALLSRWQNPGDQTSIQKLTSQTSSAAAKAATYFTSSSGIYSDASYIRMKNISLSYSLPKKYLNRMKIQGLTIYVNAQNVFTITNYLGTDPETQSFYGFPPLKTFVAGLKFNL